MMAKILTVYVFLSSVFAIILFEILDLNKLVLVQELIASSKTSNNPDLKLFYAGLCQAVIMVIYLSTLLFGFIALFLGIQMAFEHNKLAYKEIFFSLVLLSTPFLANKQSSIN